ncbi:linear amide C-N hydrolase, partial [Thermoplasmatota archaeon]
IGFNSMVLGCTGFTASNNDTVLVGNNEDYTLDCEPKIKIYPSTDEEYGRIVFCNKPYPFDNMPYYEFGGMNENGLFFDSFAVPYKHLTNPDSKPVYNGWYIPNVLKNCSTVEEAIVDFNQWHHPVLENNQILIADRFGDAAIIEGDIIIHKNNDFQVVTNFRLSNPDDGWYPCWRYDTAFDMLENMNDLSIDYFIDICNATHSDGLYSYTIYSNVYDLINGVVYLYYMHDYSTVKVFNLSEEMSLGFNSYYMSDLFNDDNISPNVPETPIGPSNGKINEEQLYASSTIDPDGDEVSYIFDWGDGNDSGWLGPFDSGDTCEAIYSWENQGNYEIRVKAKDIYDLESEWSYPLAVTMPTSYNHIPRILICLFERFPFLQPYFSHYFE